MRNSYDTTRMGGLCLACVIFCLSVTTKTLASVPESVKDTPASKTEGLSHAAPEAAGAASGKRHSDETDNETDLATMGISMAAAGDAESPHAGILPFPQTHVFTGAATTRIPIRVTPGRAGVAPGLSLNYNSFQKNGWIGLGWSIDMSAIQRSTKRGLRLDPNGRYDQDDFVAGVDGASVELVPRTDGWGAGYYSAKIEGRFSKYYFTGDNWEVTARDGRKYFYGTTPASRQYNDHGTFKWCLDRVEDTNGNYMTISYFQDMDQGEVREIYLEEIQYTGNIGLEPTNGVRFYLENRPDAPPLYHSNAKTVTDKRLKTIYVTAGSEPVRAYAMTYDLTTKTGQSFLSGVQEYGSDVMVNESTGDVTSGSHLPPVQLFYTPETGTQKGESLWGTNDCKFADKAPTFGFADFNGDARMDFAYRKDDKKELRVMLSAGTGFETDTSWGYFNKSADPQEPNQAYADFNGDGMADFAYRMDHYRRWKVKLSNGSSFGPEIKWGDYDYGIHEDEDGHRLYTFADFNGDGRTDFAYRRRGTKEIRVLLTKKTGDGFEPDTRWGEFEYEVADDPLKFAFADFNGDGKADFMYRRDNSRELHVLLSRPDEDGFQDGDYIWGEYEYDHAADAPRFGFADFNGDGRSDFLYRVRGTLELRVLLSKGYTSEETSWGTYAYGDIENNAPKVAYADFNGDGKADFMYRRLNREKWLLKLSNGKGFEPEIEWGTRLKQVDPDNPGFAFADFNGDGKTDFLYRENHTNEWNVMESDETPFVLISRMENPMGGATAIEYLASSWYPNTTLPYVVQTVSKVSVDDGQANLSVSGFSYGKGLFDYDNREFRGFGYAQQTHPDGSVIKTRFHQGEYLKGKKYQIDLCEPGAGLPIVNTKESWGKALIEGSSQFVKLEQKRTTYDGEPTLYFEQEDYTYIDENGDDMWDKLITQTSGTGAEKTTMTQLYKNCGDWIWRLEQETLEGGTSGLVRRTDYGYDESHHGWIAPPNRGNLTSKTFWNRDGASPRIEMTYDDYGNPWKEYDPEGNPPTVAEYDNLTHAYPVRITYPPTNGLAHEVAYEYDYKSGKVASAWDQNNQRSEFFYDAFGRLKQIGYPDQGRKTVSYFDEFPVHVVTKVKENGAGSVIAKYEYFDGFGRLIQTVTSGDETARPLDDPDCRSVVSWVLYDEMGRRYRTEGPVHSTGAGLQMIPESAHPYEVTQFDFRGRPVLVAGPDDDGAPLALLTRLTYHGFTTTVTDPDGRKKKEKRDYLGRIVEVTEDPDGRNITSVYQYNAAGDLQTVTVKNAQQAVLSATQMDYDTLGRKTYMNDPDTGEWAYAYDRNGNLLSQTDAKLQTITFEYDELNRLVSKAFSTVDNPVSYLYDQAPVNGMGRLYSVVKGSPQNPVAGTTYEAYDSRGRIRNVKKRIQGKEYETQYDYDLSGKLTTITYPADGYTVNYEYYRGTGLLMRAYNPNVNFAVYANYPATGKVRDILYGNGVRTAYEYFDWTGRLDSIFTYKGGLTFQYRSYQYTGAGNIAYRVDAGDLYIPDDDVSYEYEYDGLHRLVKEKINRVDHIIVAYDDMGNITSKTVGPDTFTYHYKHDAHNHAVSSISVNGASGYTCSYDPNGNMLSGPDFTNLDQVLGRTVSWNAENMPLTISKNGTLTTFVYDGEGVRVEKSVLGGPQTFYIGEHYEITDGSATRYVFANGTRIAMVNDHGAVTYFHQDHLGSSTVLTNGQGVEVSSAEYLPFGGNRKQTGEDMADYRFTDQELDPSTGLYNFRARLYDPVLGRFISPDTIVQDPYDPQMLNRYGYARNNPLIYTDPSGHFLGVDDAIRAGIGAVAGAAIAAFTGENIAQGALTGAISGLVFGWAGDIIRTAQIGSHAIKAGIHIAAGAASGAINGAISGGDMATGMLTGAVSAGTAKYGGLKLFDAGGLLTGTMSGLNPCVRHGVQLVAYSAMGGMAGGVSAQLYGGGFADGFAYGAKMAAYGYMFNWFGEKMVHGVGQAVSSAWRDVTSHDGLHEGAQKGTMAAGVVVWETFKMVRRDVLSAVTEGYSSKAVSSLSTMELIKVPARAQIIRTAGTRAVTISVKTGLGLDNYQKLAVRISNQIESF